MSSRRPKTQATGASVEAFLGLQTAARAADCRQLAAWMGEASGCAPEMWGASIVGFGRYELVSGRTVNPWPRIAFSPRKQDLVLYLMPGFEQDAETLAALGPHRHGKSCLYLKRLADVDARRLRALIERSLQRMALAYPDRGAP